MCVGIGELRQLPVFGGLRYRIGDVRAGSAEQHQLVRTRVHHVEERFHSYRGVTLKKKKRIHDVNIDHNTLNNIQSYKVLYQYQRYFANELYMCKIEYNLPADSSFYPIFLNIFLLTFLV